MNIMNEDVILKKLNEHDKRFDTLESGFQDFKHQIYATQDQILTIVRRLDEERVFSAAWAQRVEKEIANIKAHLKLS